MPAFRANFTTAALRPKNFNPFGVQLLSYDEVSFLTGFVTFSKGDLVEFARNFGSLRYFALDNSVWSPRCAASGAVARTRAGFAPWAAWTSSLFFHSRNDHPPGARPRSVSEYGVCRAQNYFSRRRDLMDDDSHKERLPTENMRVRGPLAATRAQGKIIRTLVTDEVSDTGKNQTNSSRRQYAYKNNVYVVQPCHQKQQKPGVEVWVVPVREQ
ncbi:hypothetical protein B0H16DRAFT_1474538 [Mycena metata]|uniref:Uncharacterized protein n=1 Tax=Mycena metata TaxID=1033252 RepID=A0AAD7MJX7_9AGAR|nr:hypothetical protein B0H16DRAFT_1474538 [Mycena metata]